MEGVSSVSNVGSGLAVQQQLSVRAVGKQVSVMKEQGAQAVQLIQSAAVIDPAVGNRLDVRA